MQKVRLKYKTRDAQMYNNCFYNGNTAEVLQTPIN